MSWVTTDLYTNLNESLRESLLLLWYQTCKMHHFAMNLTNSLCGRGLWFNLYQVFTVHFS